MDMRFWCEQALVGDSVESGVELVTSGGRLTGVTPGAPTSAEQTRLAGFTIPAFANAHSHAFHRALRGRAGSEAGTFWTWRQQMYAVAATLQPDSYHQLARAVFAEMALAGIGTVGEFHYLHHQDSGRPYEQPNAMGEALIAAAAEAGIRITLIDTCYLHDGVGREPQGVQVRYADASPGAWAKRVTAIGHSEMVKVAAGLHSVRALELGEMETVAAWANANGTPLHAHVSEQVDENQMCAEVYGASPIEVIARSGALSDRFTAAHFTHASHNDLEVLGQAEGMVCLCPTTERDLADGIGSARSMADRGIGICLGTDAHVATDMFEEMKAVEMNQRLVTGIREQHDPLSLLAAATVGGRRSLGWEAAGLQVGALADFTTIDRGGVHMAGIVDPVRGVVYAARPNDVTHLVVNGEVVVADRVHRRLAEPSAELDRSIASLWS